MNHTIKDVNESNEEYILRELECISDNISELNYKLMKTSDKLESLEAYTKNCIEALMKITDRQAENMIKLINALKY